MGPLSSMHVSNTAGGKPWQVLMVMVEQSRREQMLFKLMFGSFLVYSLVKPRDRLESNIKLHDKIAGRDEAWPPSVRLLSHSCK